MAVVLGGDGICLEYSKISRNIYGGIYIEGENFCFPDREWTDLVYPVIDLWSDELVKAYRFGGEMKLIFMDGSFAMFGNIKSGDLLLKCCSDPRDRCSVCGETGLPVRVFRDDLIASLSVCEKIFLSNDDSEFGDKCRKQIIRLWDMKL